jgi:beta-phosphoglucomutase-like phosphatase (HAD superfamily)
VGADVYIEESDDNVVALREAGADVIVLTNSTNTHVERQRISTRTLGRNLVGMTLARKARFEASA